jgi:hypothetical protein
MFSFPREEIDAINAWQVEEGPVGLITIIAYLEFHPKDARFRI